MASLRTQRILNLRDLKVLHIEPTDVCQAACPLCARETDPAFDKHTQNHLTLTQIQKHFSDRVISNLDKMFMCGVYGDPAAGKHTREIYQYFRSVNPTITLGMNTNGALQNRSWWYDLGKLFSQSRDYVVFSIDGLADTNHIYRRNVDWVKLMNNIRGYISAGGSAHWDMLVYQHNEHQVDQCERMARDIGFTWFRAKVSNRGLYNSRLQPATGWQLPVAAQGPINCHALKEKSAYIDAQGQLSPCCWLGESRSNTITDIEQVQPTWKSNTPNSICQITCGTTDSKTSFSNQWQREVELV